MTSKQPVDRFNAAIVEIINSFNLLDHNLGLSIAHLDSPGHSTDAYSKVSGMNVKAKVAYLTEKLRSHPDHCHVVDQEEYLAWCSEADKARYNRNRYLHGQWAFLGHLDKPVEFCAPVWMREKLGKDWKERLTLEELEEAVNELKRCAYAFITIREKNRF